MDLVIIMAVAAIIYPHAAGVFRGGSVDLVAAAEAVTLSAIIPISSGPDVATSVKSESNNRIYNMH